MNRCFKLHAKQFLLLLLAICLASTEVGCGSINDLASVTGKITLDEKPLADALVVYSPTTSGTTSYGRTTASGDYVMLFSDREKGAWLGENIVRISTGDVGKKETVPGVYNLESTLRKTVEKGPNRFNFDLKSSDGKIKQTIRE